MLRPGLVALGLQAPTQPLLPHHVPCGVTTTFSARQTLLEPTFPWRKMCPASTHSMAPSWFPRSIMAASPTKTAVLQLFSVWGLLVVAQSEDVGEEGSGEESSVCWACRLQDNPPALFPSALSSPLGAPRSVCKAQSI